MPGTSSTRREHWRWARPTQRPRRVEEQPEGTKTIVRTSELQQRTAEVCNGRPALKAVHGSCPHRDATTPRRQQADGPDARSGNIGQAPPQKSDHFDPRAPHIFDFRDIRVAKRNPEAKQRNQSSTTLASNSTLSDVSDANSSSDSRMI